MIQINARQQKLKFDKQSEGTYMYVMHVNQYSKLSESVFSATKVSDDQIEGIINVKDSEEFSDKKGLRACWGTDWPSGDTINFKRETVGLGICIPQKYIRSEEPANKDNYAFVVGTADNRMSYRIIYCSDNETFGYHSAREWFEFVKEWKKEIVERPLVIRIF